MYLEQITIIYSIDPTVGKLTELPLQLCSALRWRIILIQKANKNENNKIFVG